jgi:DNA-binding response OmpR family regulator
MNNAVMEVTESPSDTKPEEEVVRCGRHSLKVAQKKLVQESGEEVCFTPHEFQILLLLARKAGETVTKAMIMDHLYGGMHEPGLKIVDVFICKIRKKLPGPPGLIQTVRGRGYRLSTNP